MPDYITKLRKKIGHDKFIYPGARILIENEKGEFLFIKRCDNGQLGLPAGGLEEGETIEECIIREVKEETGLHIQNLQVIGISSSPFRETVQYPNGDVIQYFNIEFYSNSFTGQLDVLDTDEIKSASFKDKSYLDRLPKNEKSIIDSWEFFRKEGRVKLK